MKMFLRILFFIFVLSAQAQGVWQGKAKVSSPLYKGPGETYGLMEDSVVRGESLLISGISPGKKWYSVVKSNGVSAWIPLHRVERLSLPSEEAKELGTIFRLKRRVTSRFITQVSGTYGSRPLAVGARAQFFLNLTENGLVGKRVDQVEVGAGLGYHHYAKEPFFELPVHVQWIFRPPSTNSFMIGPKLGLSFMKDPTFPYDVAIPVEAGLHGRYFWSDYYGYFFEGSMLIRSVIYYMGSAGFVARF